MSRVFIDVYRMHYSTCRRQGSAKVTYSVCVQEDRPFRFMTNRRDDTSHAFQASCVSVLGGLAGLLLPHCRIVTRILNARVPIIKLRHHGTELDCDVTYQGQ